MKYYNFDLIIISDRAADGTRKDETIPVVRSWCTNSVFHLRHTVIVPDEEQEIRRVLLDSVNTNDCSLIITSGGTGFSPRDITPEVTQSLVQKRTPGIDEYLRQQGIQKTAFAALSRGISGIVSDTLIINLPGSPQAVLEGLASLEKILPHALQVIKGQVTDMDHKENRGRK